MDAASVLVVEDDEALREALCDTLRLAGHRTIAACDGTTALSALSGDRVDVVVSDLQMQPMDGAELLAAIRARQPALPVVLMTAYGSIRQAVELMRSGATEYIVKPFEASELTALVGRYAPAGEHDDDGMVAVDPRSRELKQLASRLAATDTTVLLTGESGTGKEVYARYLHRASHRAAGPFVAINCAAIPETMLEAILFGYERGAYTGAQGAHAGKFEQAHGGTLLLDEVSELPLNLQSKLLRVLQEREVERLGSSRTIALDTRVVAATNRPLRRLVEQGRFREDLYYRLSVFPLEIPPLRERPGDVLPLFAASLRRHCRGRRTIPTLTEAAEQSLRTHGWPGNVRELDNLAQRALVLLHGDVISTPHLHFEATLPGAPPLPPTPGAALGPPSAPPAERLGDALRSSETRLILDALQRGQGSRKRAAEILGISPRTLRYKLAQLRAAGVQTVGA